MTGERDPGWGAAWRMFGRMAVNPARRWTQEGVDGLVTVRAVFLAFCVALVGIGVVVLFIGGGETEGDPPTILVAVLLAVAVIGLVVGSRFEPRLDCADDKKLAEGYRSRLFMRIALAETPALLGFAGCFLIREVWPYFVGLAITALALARAAPTAWALRRDQAALDARGCGRSLVAALRRPQTGQ